MTAPPRLFVRLLATGGALLIPLTTLTTATAAPTATAATVTAATPTPEPSSAPVRVYPVPGTTTISPDTQVSFRGIGQLPAGGVTVTGSVSGRHPGHWLAHSDGHGFSFVPDRPFVPGETVTVRTHLAIAGAAGGTFRWRVTGAVQGPAESAADLDLPAATAARPTPTARPTHTRRATGRAERTGTVRPDTTADPSYLSRPDLTPDGIDVTTAASGEATTDLLFGGAWSQAGEPDPHNYAMIYRPDGEPVWLQAPSTGYAIGNPVPVTYLGRPAIAYFEFHAPSPSADWYEGTWYVVDDTYQVIGTIKAGNGYQADVHELLVNGNDAFLIIYHAVPDIDLSDCQSSPNGPGAGPSSATVEEAVVQEVDIPTGAVLFEWHSLSGATDCLNGNVPVNDTELPMSTLEAENPNIDYFHPNALTLDPNDDNVVVSGRHLSALIKLDLSGTGSDIVWHFGGRENSFAFSNPLNSDPATSCLQHDARFDSTTEISVFDNGNCRGYSRGLAWTIDEQNLTATVTVDQRHSPDIFAAYTGSNRPLPGGDWLIDWGNTGTVTEYTSTGTIDYENHFVDAAGQGACAGVSTPCGEFSYRTVSDNGWTGTPAEQPAMALVRAGGSVTAYASWNGATGLTGWDLLAGPDTGHLSTLVSGAAPTGFETAITSPVTAADQVFEVVAHQSTTSATSLPQPVQVGVEGTNGQLWVNEGQTSWAARAGGLLSPPAVVNAGGLNYYFVVGADHRVYVSDDAQSWAAYTSATTYCNGVAATFANGSFVVTCRGSDNRAWLSTAGYHAGALPGPASGWLNLGGVTYQPLATAVTNGVLTVYVTGTDGYVYTRTPSTGWVRQSAWRCVGPPAVATIGTLTVWACPGTDGNLWYATFDGGWSATVNAGTPGAITGQPAIALTRLGPTFVTQGPGQVPYERTQGSRWTSLGGQAVGGVGAVG